MSPQEAKNLVFQHWQYINQLAYKRFPQDNQLAEQAIDYVLEQLEKNHWQKVCQYQGKGFTAFITVTTSRLLIDFARKSGEMPHIPKWIQQAEPIWKQVFLLLHKGESKSDIIQKLTENSDISKQEIINIIMTIKQKHSFNTTIQQNDTEQLENIKSDADNPEQMLTTSEHHAWFSIIFQSIKQTNMTIESKQLKVLADRLQHYITLTAEERLFLLMIYQDELSVSEAGRRLHWNQNQAAGKHKRLLARLQTSFEQAGLIQDIKSLLQ
jgi:RNA polymerase sigma factor (sigma-70 family)